ncbi:MAG: 2,3-bisphosphoglycerate-independent phosphoglycerate mutase [Candidatus Edwardsbacteria bacterium]
MIDLDILKSLILKNDKKIVLVVIDGIGGLPLDIDGKTELETAAKPFLDELASRSICGLTEAISPGITPGSGPAHLALFGYDPIKYQIGRGVLEALGIGLMLTPQDLSARANFATMNEENIITDRRAGRIPTEKNQQLCSLLQEKISKIDDCEIIIRHGKEHRFVVIFRGEGLSDELTDTDPQKEGKKASLAEALNPKAEKAARLINEFVRRANEILSPHSPANTILLRGLAKCPQIPSLGELYGLRPAAIATYPMYKGLARLVGMKILESCETIEDEFLTLQKNFAKYDFFYLHIKKTDSFGEDGNFAEKVNVIIQVDSQIPILTKLKPDVIVVTSDHSTPALLKGHSWHPNPFVLCSPTCRPDDVREFSESACLKGGLGRFPAVEAMPLMLAHALKLAKLGA